MPWTQRVFCRTAAVERRRESSARRDQLAVRVAHAQETRLRPPDRADQPGRARSPRSGIRRRTAPPRPRLARSSASAIERCRGRSRSRPRPPAAPRPARRARPAPCRAPRRTRRHSGRRPSASAAAAPAAPAAARNRPPPAPASISASAGGMDHVLGIVQDHAAVATAAARLVRVERGVEPVEAIGLGGRAVARRGPRCRTRGSPPAPRIAAASVAGSLR